MSIDARDGSKISWFLWLASLLAGLLWTVLISALLFYHYVESKKNIEQLANEAALESIERDLIYRSWAAQFGGVYVPITQKTLPNSLLADIKDRDITAPSGKKLTLMSPTRMVRQAHELAKDRYGDYSHITSLKPLDPENSPDAWEARALTLLDQGKAEYGEVVTLDGAEYFRLMVPLKVENSCLSCHAAQGYRLDEQRGGISVAVPMKDYDHVLRSHVRSEVKRYGTIWLIGIAGIALVTPFVRRRLEEREHARQALTESEERYRNLYIHTPVMLHSIDRTGRILNVSEHWLKKMGYSREEVIGHRSTEFLTEDSRRYATEVILPDFYRTGSCSEVSYQMVAKDGRVLDVLLSATAERDSSGEVTHSLAVIEDVTLRKKTEGMLEESEQRFRDTLEYINLIGVGLDTAGTIEFINAHALNLLGRSRGEMVNKNWFAVCVPPETAQKARTAFVDSMKDGVVPAHSTSEIITRSGAPRMVAWSNAVLRDVIGNVIGTISIGDDITERVRAEEALRESEKRYRTLFEQAGDYVMVLETQRQGVPVIVDLNEAALRAHGYARDELLGKPVSMLEPNVSSLESAEREVQIARSGSTLFNVRHQRKDGTLFDCEVRARSMRIGTKNLILSIERDVTERMQAEARRMQLEEQLLQAQKIESIGRLAGGVAHDINNMLMPIMGYADMLSQTIPQGDPRRSHVDEINRSAERVRDIARQLLAFARKQTLEMKILNLNEVIAGFGKMLRRTIRENIVIETRSAQNSLLVMGDTGQIEQVILNLAINAQDAMPNGGTLIIETVAVVLGQAFLESHKGATTGEFVLMSITDTGMGMNKEVQARIFEPFFTTKERDLGTGLGLAMVYGIVKQHGGYIDVESMPGKGSVFSLYLPRTMQPPHLAEVETVPQAVKGGTETVLIAEDQEDVLNVVSAMLKDHGYHVLRATTAEAAVALAESHPGKIDLLIADVIMPGMNGTEIYNRVKKDRGAMKVLYMSGYPTDVISTQGVLHSGLNFIQKPFAVSALMSKVRSVLDNAV